MIDWRVRWEHDITGDEHEELASFIHATHAAAGSPYANVYQGRRSWPGVRPELRVIGRDDDGMVAHISMLRRFLRIGEADQLVAEIGQVAVRPDLQRSGVGLEAGKRILAVLHELKAPFAFGIVRPEVLRFYSSTGSLVVEGARVRTFDSLDQWTPRLEQGLVLITPIASTFDEWPSGDIIDRNGEEL